jgi:hypothetical protein
VIPFWHRGRIQGLIRRKVAGEPRYILPKAEEFPGGYRPLFIPGPLGREIFLVEGYIDALAIAITDRSAIAIGGTHISEAQSAEIQKVVREDATIYVLPDDDESGKEAARTWGRQFFPREWLSWFQRHPNLETSKPVPVSVGGASGMQIDVTSSSTLETYPRDVCDSTPCVPLFTTSGGPTVLFLRMREGRTGTSSWTSEARR